MTPGTRLQPPANDNPIVQPNDAPVVPHARFSRAWTQHFQRVADTLASDAWFDARMRAWLSGLPTTAPGGPGVPWLNAGTLMFTMLLTDDTGRTLLTDTGAQLMT